MPPAGDVDYEGPVLGLHEDASRLGAGGVVGGGAAAVRALHTAAHLLLHPPLTVVALLQAHRQGAVLTLTQSDIFNTTITVDGPQCTVWQHFS